MAPPSAVVQPDRVEQPAATEHAEQRHARQRDEAVRLFAGHVLDQLEHLRRPDAVDSGGSSAAERSKNALAAISRIAVVMRA